MTGALLVIIVLAFLGALIAVRVMATQQASIVTPLPPEEARRIVEAYFRPAIWSRVNGPGEINLKPKLRAHAPTVSLDIEPSGSGSQVSAWASAYTTIYGIAVNHGTLVIRKRRGLAKRLLAPAGAFPSA